MVDSHYIKRGEKLYGPYYYRSYRVGKKVKKEYLGKNRPKKIREKKSGKSLSVLFVLLILTVSALYLMPNFKGITSKVTAELGGTTPESNESSQIPDNLAAEISEAITSTNSQVNLSEPANIAINETDVEENEIDVSAINITYPLVEQPVANLSNATDATEQQVEIKAIVLNETLIQRKAVVGMPVRWTRRITLDSPNSMIVELPKEASNITVKRIVNNAEELPLANAISITGQVTSEIKLKGRNLTAFDYLRFIVRRIRASITGHAIEEMFQIELKTSESKKILEIKENVTEVEIEYYTEAPDAEEKRISQGKKEITITGSDALHYADVLAYASIDEIVPIQKKVAVSLYHLVNETKELTDFTAYDENNNGFIDRIEWVVPSLSNQTYEASIILINVQSYPILNGNWTVFFNTTGEADLRITAVDGTTWNTSNQCGTETCQLRFENLTCGSILLDAAFENSSVLYSNYSCAETGTETSWELQLGKHALKFEFGSDEGYAFNDVEGINITGCSNITVSGRYVLNKSITNWAGNGACINITVSDVFLDCNDFTIDGNDVENSRGISAKQTTGASKLTNITIANCVLTDWAPGINFNRTENSTIANITGNNNYKRAILFSNSDHNNITNVSASSSSYQDGIKLEQDSNYNRLTDISASSNGEQGIHLTGSDFCNLTNINASNNVKNGIYLYTSPGNNFINITTSSNGDYGVYLWSVSYNNRFVNGTVNLNTDGGVGLDDGDKNEFIDFLSYDNKGDGFMLTNSDSNNITNSSVYNNSFSGISIGTASDSNTVYGCSIYNQSNSSRAGIYLSTAGGTSPNKIYNNIINNTPFGGNNWRAAGSANYTNYFNTTQTAGTNIIGGSWIGGNYWSDYSGIDPEADGIGDTHYVINGSLMNDSLPLMYNNLPNITLYAPENESSSLSPVNFIFNVTDDNNIANCSLIRVFPTPVTLLQTDNTITKNINQSIAQDLAMGNYILQVNCTDAGNNMASSEKRNITINGPPDTYTNITGCVNITSAGLYRLNKSITDWAGAVVCINITVSDIEIECIGWNNWLDGGDTIGTIGINTEGLASAKLTNVSIKNCNFTDWYYGVYSVFIENSSVINLSITSDIKYGIYSNKSNLNIHNSTIFNFGTAAIPAYGVYLYSSNNSFLDGNNLSGITGDERNCADSCNPGGGILLKRSNNNTISAIDINGQSVSDYGIYLTSISNNNNLSNINTSNLLNGIALSVSSNNTLSGINASFSYSSALTLSRSNNTNITNANFSNNQDNGASLSQSFGNILIKITSSGNFRNGVNLDSSSYNQVINSTIRDNKQHGMWIDSVYNNVTGSRIENNSNPSYAGIYLQAFFGENANYNRFWNNIINNTYISGGRNWKTYGENYTNYFNTTQTAGTNIIGGSWIGGNYWSDYSGIDPEADGIGDTHYVINGSLMNDSLPLVYISDESPNVTFTYPTPEDNVRQIRNWIFVNVTVNHTYYNVDACILEWCDGICLNETMDKIGSGKSITCWKNKTTADGTAYAYRAYANNSLNILGNTSARTNLENSAPNAVNLIFPPQEASTTNRTPQLNWSESTDEDGDSITYQVNITCNPACSADNRLFNSSDDKNWTTIASRLLYFWDDQYYYNWTARAWDGYEFGAWNNTPYTLKLSSTILLVMLNASVNFSELNIGETANTTTDDPFPLSIRNNGNCFVNINMSNETGLLWNTQKNPSSYFQYKIDNLTGKENSFNWTASITSWTDVPAGNNTVISFFNYTDTTDSAEIDILISVPPDESAGTKSSRLVFTGWYMRET